MRQFILGGKVAYASGNDISAVDEGAVGIYINGDSGSVLSTTGEDVVDEATLVLGRANSNGGPVIIPINKHNFRYVKGVYSAAKKFAAEVTLTAPSKVGDYSIIIVKKGVKFNERNKWTASVHVRDTTMTAAVLAGKLKDLINANDSGCVATVTAAKLKIEAVNSGEDYSVIAADLLTDLNVSGNDGTFCITPITSGNVAYGDAAYVQDLAEKAAADAGIEYTYRDAYNYLYPNYLLNSLTQSDSTDDGYTIFTLTFDEPRKVKTTIDDVIKQIVQVAFPTGASQITTFETVCKGIAGISTSTSKNTKNISN